MRSSSNTVRCVILTFISVALTVSLPAAQPNPAPWTIDDVVLGESTGSWVIAGDGTQAAWIRQTVEQVGEEEKQVSRLWLTNLEDASSRQLTRGYDNAAAPRFSPDGAHLGFLFDRPIPGQKPGDRLGKRQLWVLPVAGGEAFPVTRFEHKIASFGWVDSETLLVAAAEAPLLWELQHKQHKDTSIVVADEEHEPPVRLFTVKLRGDKVQRLTTNDDWIDDLVVSPDGRRAVVRAQQSLWYEFDNRIPPRTFVLSLPTGELQPLFDGTELVPSAVQWRRDSSGFFFVHQHSDHPVYRMASVNQLWYHDLSSGDTGQVELSWDRGLARDSVSGFQVTENGVIALLANGVSYRPVRLTREQGAWRSQLLSGAHQDSIDGFTLCPDGHTLVYRSSTATRSPQWYRAELVGGEIREESELTDLNQRFADKPCGRVEVLHWQGAGGEEVEGLLHYPLQWQQGHRYPLLVVIHGGPTGTDRDTWSLSWSRPLMLWRQRGAFLLQVNYHGSAGYGLAWATSIAGGRYYELEIPDIEAGVDLVVNRGLVDPERLGSVGWSNGGILTAELITRTQRYRAASVGAADVEWFSDWANVDFGAAFDNYYFGGTPWEVPEVYLQKSPFFRLTRVTTPTIVFTGTKDTNVPPHQSWSLFRALKQIGRTQARLVLFPDEPHGLRTIAHQRRKLEEELAWFDRYLFARESPSSQGVKPGSLLAGLLERAAAARDGAALGLQVGGVLVPETVAYKGLEIGRFEVTQAQMAAFDHEYEVAPGAENMPANGISFATAQRYVEWLSQKTGEDYRLPTQEEARKLAGSGGNTLDHWAGYSPNPDDTRSITAELASVGAAALLLPVGSLTGAGEEALVYDLDGNVAEWATTEDGGGEPMGPSADQPQDKRSRCIPAPEYIGMRVLVTR